MTLRTGGRSSCLGILLVVSLALLIVEGFIFLRSSLLAPLWSSGGGINDPQHRSSALVTGYTHEVLVCIVAPVIYFRFTDLDRPVVGPCGASGPRVWEGQ